MTLIIFIPHQLLSSPIPSSLFLLISTRQSCFHALYNYVCVYESIQNPGLTDEKKEWAFVFLKRWAMFELSSRYLCLDTYGWGFYSTLGSEESWWISESFLSCLIASSRRALPLSGSHGSGASIIKVGMQRSKNPACSINGLLQWGWEPNSLALP